MHQSGKAKCDLCSTFLNVDFAYTDDKRSINPFTQCKTCASSTGVVAKNGACEQCPQGTFASFAVDPETGKGTSECKVCSSGFFNADTSEVKAYQEAVLDKIPTTGDQIWEYQCDYRIGKSYVTDYEKIAALYPNVVRQVQVTDRGYDIIRNGASIRHSPFMKVSVLKIGGGGTISADYWFGSSLNSVTSAVEHPQDLMPKWRKDGSSVEEVSSCKCRPDSHAAKSNVPCGKWCPCVSP